MFVCLFWGVALMSLFISTLFHISVKVAIFVLIFYHRLSEVFSNFAGTESGEGAMADCLRTVFDISSTLFFPPKSTKFVSSRTPFVLFCFFTILFFVVFLFLVAATAIVHAFRTTVHEHPSEKGLMTSSGDSSHALDRFGGVSRSLGGIPGGGRLSLALQATHQSLDVLQLVDGLLQGGFRRAVPLARAALVTLLVGPWTGLPAPGLGGLG